MNAYECDEQVAMLKSISAQATEKAYSLQRVLDLLKKIHSFNSQPQQQQPQQQPKRKDHK